MRTAFALTFSLILLVKTASADRNALRRKTRVLVGDNEADPVAYDGASEHRTLTSANMEYTLGDEEAREPGKGAKSVKESGKSSSNKAGPSSLSTKSGAKSISTKAPKRTKSSKSSKSAYKSSKTTTSFGNETHNNTKVPSGPPKRENTKTFSGTENVLTLEIVDMSGNDMNEEEIQLSQDAEGVATKDVVMPDHGMDEEEEDLLSESENAEVVAIENVVVMSGHDIEEEEDELTTYLLSIPFFEEGMSMPPSAVPSAVPSAMPSAVPSTVPSAPPVKCYNSTTAIVQAQLADPPVKSFNICPGTTIKVGLPANAEFTQFVGGDLPLSVLHDNVTIQCGAKGDPADRCIFTGGYFQLITSPVVALVQGRKVSTNNLRIKGLTFTGQLTSPVPGVVTTSIALGAPGTGMIFEDCSFKNLTSDFTIINSRNSLTAPEDLPFYSSELTVRNCTFENITYSSGVIANLRQNVTVTNSRFDNIKWAKCASCPPSTLPVYLVGNLAGSMKLSNNTFGASDIVQTAVAWLNFTSNGVPSILMYSNNTKSSDLMIVNATGRQDYCEAGLLFRNSSNGFGECLNLFSDVPSVKCYNSTTAIVQAQLADPPVKSFNICPGTTIKVGLPANAEFTQFVGGDLPLSALHDNVTIQCGAKGDPADRCIFTGGYFQLVTSPVVALVPGRKVSTNNLRIKGLTFTGQLTTQVPGVATSSIALGAPGTGMIFEDCSFKNLTSDFIITNSRNSLTAPEDLPFYSSELTVRNCTFENITYSSGVIANWRQNMTVTNSRFDNIKWAKCASCPPSTLPVFLVGNLAGSMKLSNNTFGASDIVQTAAAWLNFTSNGVPSILMYSNNTKSSDLVIVNATGRQDYCEAGLLFQNSSNGFGECLNLFSDVPSVKCYNSTTAIVQAQLADPPVKSFNICPGTTIKVGLPANAEFTQFVGGDLPLSALHDNVTIQCGAKGDPADRCIFTGGYFQLVTSPVVALVPGRKVSTNNLRIKGLTFTGQLTTQVPGVATSSIALGAPGTGMIFEDCSFKNLTSDFIITNSRNSLTAPEDLPFYSSELTVRNCTFENITYSSGVIANWRQNMTVTNSRFDNIKWAKCASCPPSTLPVYLVGNLAGSMKLSNNTFGASDIVQTAAAWLNFTSNGVPSILMYSNNTKSSDLVIVNATGRQDYCEAGLLFQNSSNGFGECLNLF